MNYYTSNTDSQMEEQHQRVATPRIFLMNPDKFGWHRTEARFDLKPFEWVILFLFKQRNIQTFLLRNENALKDDKHFWKKAITKGIPNMLRWLFVKSIRIEFSVSCYVNLKNIVLVFTSGTLTIEHYYDVEESIAVLCKMLRRRIDDYLALSCGVRLANCTVQQFRLNVNRTTDYGDIENSLKLPIQYRSLLLQQSQQDDLRRVHAEVAQHLRDGSLPVPINYMLYRLEPSPQTKELQMVHHHTGGNQHLNESSRTFLIINDILGNFSNVLEISNPLVCSEEPQKIVNCQQCGRKFKKSISFDIHEQLKCGQQLSVDAIDQDFDEVLKNSLAISSDEHKYAWYGIMNAKHLVEKESSIAIDR